MSQFKIKIISAEVVTATFPAYFLIANCTLHTITLLLHTYTFAFRLFFLCHSTFYFCYSTLFSPPTSYILRKLQSLDCYTAYCNQLSANKDSFHSVICDCIYCQWKLLFVPVVLKNIFGIPPVRIPPPL